MDAAAVAMRVAIKRGELPESLEGRRDGGRQQLAHVLPPTVMDSSEGDQRGISDRRPLPLERESFVGTAREAAGQNRDISNVVNDQKCPDLYHDLEKGKVKKKAALGKDGDAAPSYYHQDSEDESQCRVCHMSTATPDAINLGCACKLDLGRVHKGCAEKWFNIKGNRKCEICGEVAQNVHLAGVSCCLDTQDIVIVNNLNRGGAARVMFLRSLAICLLWVAFIVLLYKFILPVLRRIHRNQGDS